MLGEGYAIGSINGRLSTVRTYARIAAKAGAITAKESFLIGSVQGYASKEARQIDDKRRADGMQTRKGHKKAEALKSQPATTEQGRRDALIMCLLLDHGLRVSEIAILTRAALDLKAGTFTFYRPKVNKTQTHELTPDTPPHSRRATARQLIVWWICSAGTARLWPFDISKPRTLPTMERRG